MRKILATLLLVLLNPNLVHAQENRAGLAATYNSQLPDNATGQITPQTMRGVFNTLTSSVVAISGDANVIGNTLLAQMTGATVKANINGSTGNVADVSLASFFGAAPTASIPAAAVMGGGGGGLSVTDGSAFTAGTSLFTPIGGTFNTSITPLISGEQGTAALTANRSVHTLDDNSGAILSALQAPIPAGANTIGNTVGLGAVTTASPTYGTGTNQFLSLDTSGNLRVTGSFSLGGFATTAAPTYGNNTSQLLSLDTSGNLRVTGSSVGTVTQGTAAASSGAWPVKVTDGTNVVAIKPASTSPLATDPAIVVALSPNSASLLPASGTAPTADPGEAVVSACQYNSSAPTPSTTNTMALQCDSAGRLITSGSGLAQGSTTSGQLGGLTMGAVTTSAPTYTTAQTSPISLDTAGNIRVNVAAGSAGNAASGATGSAVPAQASVGGLNVAGNTRGATGVNPSGVIYAQQMDLASVAGTTVATGTGAGGAGIPRVTVSNDSTLALLAGSALIGKVGIDQTTVGTTNGISIAQIGAVTAASGNGTSGTGNLRVNIASDNSAVSGLGAGATGASVPANGVLQGGRAQNAEQTAVTNGQMVAQALDLTGKIITSPFANKENMVRGSASATNTSATTIIAAGGASVKTYITGVQCYRSDTGTVALTVTLNDSASTVLVLPNSAGGGGSNVTFATPLVTAANTAFQFTSGTSATTVYCSAQGFSGS